MYGYPAGNSPKISLNKKKHQEGLVQIVCGCCVARKKNFLRSSHHSFLLASAFVILARMSVSLTAHAPAAHCKELELGSLLVPSTDRLERKAYSDK